MPSALASPTGIAAARTRSRVGAMLLALLLPAFMLRAWSSAYADALGAEIAACLIAVVPALPQLPEDGVPEEEEPPLDDAPSVRGMTVDVARPKKTSPRRVVPQSGVRVSSAQVLALAGRRAMPRAQFVKANTQHPAGLLLSGVSGLGIGMQDGDVLTEAAGQKVSSLAAVVGIVLAARARQAAEISGRFYRGGVPFSLTVEQPYPKAPVPG